MKKIICCYTLMLLIGISVSAQTKKTSEKNVFVPTSEQKEKIVKINQEFRAKQLQLNASEKNLVIRISKIQQLRDLRDSSILVLLGEEQYNKYRQQSSPKSNPEKYDKSKSDQQARVLKQSLSLSEEQVKEVKKIQYSYFLERKKIIGGPHNQLNGQAQLDSLVHVKEEKLRTILSEKQFGIYLQQKHK